MLSLEEIEKQKEFINTRLHVTEKKIAILKKKLEECAKNNQPAPASTCDNKPLQEAQKELKTLQIKAVNLAHMEQIRSWKKGDQVLCFSRGDRSVDRETGFSPFEYHLALERLGSNSHGFYHDRMFLVELEINERRKDGRLLATSVGGKKQFLGVPVTNQNSDWDTELQKYIESYSESISFFRLIK